MSIIPYKKEGAKYGSEIFEPRYGLITTRVCAFRPIQKSRTCQTLYGNAYKHAWYRAFVIGLLLGFYKAASF